MSAKILFLTMSIFLTVLATAVFAQPVTHMDVGPFDHITLEKSCALGKAICGLVGFKKTLPDGTTEVDPFKIPERYVLVVTDVDWNLHGKSNFDWFLAGQPVTAELSRTQKSGSDSNRPFISTATFATTSFCDPLTDCEEEISAGSNTQMTNGFVVTSDADLISTFQAENLKLLNDGLFQIKVRGYLLPVE